MHTILIYSGFYLQNLDSPDAPFADFALALLAFVGSLGSYFLVKMLPRRTTIVISSVVYLVTNAVIVVGMLISEPVVIYAPMLVASILYGVTYSTVSSIYPAEITKR